MAFSLKGKLGIPDSRYATELGKSTIEARFAPDLEEEYDVFFLAERRSQVRSFNGMLCALSIWALLAAFGGSTAAHDLAQLLRLSVIVASCAAVTWAAFSRLYQEVYLGTARWASLLIAMAGSFEIAHRIAAGQTEALAWLTAYSIGLFFMAGMRFGAALQANLALLASFVVALIVDDRSAVQLMHAAGVLLVILLIVGLVYFQQAARYRKAFLERGMIADLANRDPLTGLRNRRALDEHLVRAWQQALRDRKSLALMFIDVDGFKKFNDRYGHKAGDVALQRIAGVVHGVARRALDLAARYGGEELAVVLYDVPRETAAQMAEAMRIGVMNLGIEHQDGTPLNLVTISIGVGIVRPTLARSPDGAVQLSDEALYAAKRNGRNRVELFESEYEALSTGTFRAR
ncbi:MAG TPA: diguanylate cyclase [Steroidobacteraceae bacterium]